MTENLERQIAQKQRELDIVTAVDNLRDQITEQDRPTVMYMRLLKLLVNELATDGGALAVHSADSHLEDTILHIGLAKQHAEALCQPIMQATTGDALQPINSEGWAHGVGLRIMLHDTEQPLGAVVLLRGNTAQPFTEGDLSVLRTAAYQLDSALVQAQRIWRLALRNRELDTIFRLDKLRDEKTEEKDLVNGFIQIMVEQFRAELCLVILSDMDTNEMTARGVVDKIGLKPTDYSDVHDRLRAITELSDIEAPRPGVFAIGTPFIINGMQLGGVVVGRKTPFGAEDRRLLVAMSSQMDSAIVYSRVIYQLSQRNKELEIIYHIDQIRDRETDFDALLQAVLGELCTAIESEMGYILLYSRDEEEQLEIKSSTDDGIIPSPAYYEAIHTISRQALAAGEMVVSNIAKDGVRSIIAVPLILRNKIIGVFGGVNSRNTHGFNTEDRRMLNAIVSQTDTAIFERMEQRRVRQVLGRSVDPKVLEHLLANADSSNILAGERMNISVIFGDLRGSTEWAERTEPHKLATLLNAYLGRMADVIFKHGGTLDKFVGDEVIGLFGAPLPMEDHAERCAAAGLEMQSVMQNLIREMEAEGCELPPMGVGISTGDAICGEFGAAARTDYTAMGRMMNLGARLCGLASGGEVIISETTYEALTKRAKVEQLARVDAKGIGQVTAYKLINLESNR